MPNDCFSVVVITRKLSPQAVRAVGYPRLEFSNCNVRHSRYQILRRHGIRSNILEYHETIHFEAGALPGPALPFPLGYLETERLGAIVSDGELRSVHWLESDWVPPVHEFRAVVARFSQLKFELIYIEPNQSFCGAMIGLDGEVAGRYEADFDALEAATDLLPPAELAEKPAYLTNYRWFLLIQAHRDAGLRTGQVVLLPSPDRSNTWGPELMEAAREDGQPF